jgi:hypothetical protein
LTLDKWGYEVWQLEGTGPVPDQPHYVLPILAAAGPNMGNIDEQRLLGQPGYHCLGGCGKRQQYIQAALCSDGALATSATGITGGSAHAQPGSGRLAAAVKPNSPTEGLPALRSTKMTCLSCLSSSRASLLFRPSIAQELRRCHRFANPGVLDDLYTYEWPARDKLGRHVPTTAF